MVLNFLFGNEAETGGGELIGPPPPAAATITQPHADEFLPAPAAQGGGGGGTAADPTPTPSSSGRDRGVGGGHPAPIDAAYSGFNSVVKQLGHTTCLTAR